MSLGKIGICLDCSPEVVGRRLVVFPCGLVEIEAAQIVEIIGDVVRAAFFGLWSGGRLPHATGQDDQGQSNRPGCQPYRPASHGTPSFAQCTLALHGFPSLKQFQVGAHFPGVLVALTQVGGTSSKENLVEFEQAGVVGARSDIGGQCGEFLAILSKSGFVQHLAQREKVALRRARSFRCDVARRAHERMGVVHRGGESGIRQLRLAAHKDDV